MGPLHDRARCRDRTAGTRVAKRHADRLDRTKACVLRRKHGERLTWKLARTQQHQLEDQASCSACGLCTPAGTADSAVVLAYAVRYMTAFFARELLGDARVEILIARCVAPERIEQADAEKESGRPST
jgi:hypothetical protein